MKKLVIKGNKFKEYFLLFIIYFFAHGLILIDEGVFWDDWTLISNDSIDIIDYYSQSGIPAFGYFLSWLMKLPSPVLIFNILTFVFFLGAGLFLYQILRKIDCFSNTEAFWLAAIFLVIPQNLARNAMINLPYSACYFLFFFAFWTFQKHIINIQYKLVYRVLALLLFFTSFFTNSLLVFFLIVPGYLLYIYQPKTILQAIKLFLKFSDILILPVLFWIIKKNFFKLYGLFASTHYNEITFKNLLRIPVNIILTFKYSLSDMLISSLQVIINLPVLIMFLLFFGIGFFAYRIEGKQILKYIGEPWFKNLLFLALGVLLFVCGAFPYAAIGGHPMEYDWHGRHQLLLPLGTSFIIFYAIKMLPDRDIVIARIKGFVFCLIICSFILKDQITYISYQRDWVKQEALILHLKKMPEIRKQKTFIFEDEANEMNVFNRTYRFYEFSGMFNQIFGDKSRFAVISGTNPNDFRKFKAEYISWAKINNFNMQKWRAQLPHVKIKIKKGAFDLTLFNIIYLRYLELTSNPLYKKKLGNVLDLEVINL